MPYAVWTLLHVVARTDPDAHPLRVWRDHTEQDASVRIHAGILRFRHVGDRRLAVVERLRPAHLTAESNTKAENGNSGSHGSSFAW